MKNKTCLTTVLLVVSLLVASAQNAFFPSISFSNPAERTVFSMSGNVVYRTNGTSIGSEVLKNWSPGVYLIYDQTFAFKVAVVDGEATIPSLIQHDQTLPPPAETKLAKSVHALLDTIHKFILPIPIPLTSQPVRNHRASWSGKLQGNYYMAQIADLIEGNAYNNLVDQRFRVPYYEPYVIPDADMRFLFKSDTTFFACSSQSSYKKHDRRGWQYFFDGYHYDAVTQQHSIWGFPISVTHSTIMLPGGMTLPSIVVGINPDSVTNIEITLCLHEPPVTVSCAAIPWAPKPTNMAALKQWAVDHYGAPLVTVEDTLKAATKAVYQLLASLNGRDGQITNTAQYTHCFSRNYPFNQYITDLTTGPWGVLCGGYATALARLLEEGFGMRAVTTNIANITPNGNGHAQTVVEVLKPRPSTMPQLSPYPCPSVALDCIPISSWVEYDTLYYLLDAANNTYALDSNEAMVDLHTHINMIGDSRWTELHYADNYQLGPALVEGPCQIFSTRLWTPVNYVERPGPNSYLYRYYGVQTIEMLAATLCYQDISNDWEPYLPAGAEFNGDFEDFTLSPIWIHDVGSTGTGDMDISNKIMSWIHEVRTL